MVMFAPDLLEYEGQLGVWCLGCEGREEKQSLEKQLQITPAWKFLVILQTLISWIMCV